MYGYGYRYNSGLVLGAGGGGGGFVNTYSLDYDGVDDYVDLGDAFTSLTAFSISAWFKSDDTASSNQSIVSSRIGSIGVSQGIDIFINSNQLYARIYDNGATQVITSFTDTSSWHQVLLTYNGTNLEMYLNGASQGTSAGSYTNSSADWLIGKWNNGAFYFNGKIDEAAIFNSAIAIGDVWNGSGKPTDLTDLSPVAWYRMGDNGVYKSPQFLLPNDENKDKVSNYSFELDGIDDKVELGTQSFGITGAISLSTWIKIPTTNTGGGGTNIQIIAAEDRTSGTNRNWSLSWRGGGRNEISAVIFDGGGGALVATTTAIVPNDGNWHHVMFTYTGDTSTDGLKLFVDGIQRAQATSSNGGTRSTTAVVPTIGGLSQSITWMFEGNIDELSIFNTDQSANVSSIYNGGEPTTISGAVAHYKMGEEANFTSNWLVDNSALTNYSKRSFDFDGVDDYIDCGQVTQIQNTNALSVSCWFNYKSLSASVNSIVSKDSTTRSDGNWYIATQNATIRFLLKTANGQDALNSGTISLNSWNHLLCVWNGSTMSIYINGTLDNSISLSNATGTLGLRTSDVMIGRRLVGSVADGFFNGGIDEVAVWNTDQSANASTIYNGGEPTTISGAAAHWRMGEDASFNGTNWTVPDNLGSNDGTSNAMTVDDLVGEAPNYSGGGISSGMTIEDRVGEAPNSENNALSYNMDKEDRVQETP